MFELWFRGVLAVSLAGGEDRGPEGTPTSAVQRPKFVGRLERSLRGSAQYIFHMESGMHCHRVVYQCRLACQHRLI